MAERIFLLNQHRRMRRIAAWRRPAADSDALLAALHRRELVFTITAGRTGTTYLTRLCELLPDTCSVHEPQPSYVHFLRQVQRRPALATTFLLEYKLPSIAATTESRYVETSHLFAKGFLDPLLALGLLPGIVLLRRHPRDIARSLLTRRTVPGRGKLGFKYLVHPGDPGVLPLPDWTAYSDYQLCFWYALEMERRQRVYGERLAALGANVVDVTAEELHDPACFLAFAEQLRLLDPHTDRAGLVRRHAQVSAKLYNANRRAEAIVRDLDAEEAAVWAAVEPAAPWLADEVARRYAAPPLSSRVASRS